MSAIHSLAFLHKMYGYPLSDDNKHTLIDALVDKEPDGAMLPEIPSLIFMMHALQTDRNRDQVVDVARTLSAIYLDVIGERLDALGCSNLLSGWAELGIRDEDLFATLAQIAAEKAS